MLNVYRVLSGCFWYPPEFLLVFMMWPNTELFEMKSASRWVLLSSVVVVWVQSYMLIWSETEGDHYFKRLQGKRYRHELSNNFIFLYTYWDYCGCLWLYSNVFLVVLCAWCHILFDKISQCSAFWVLFVFLFNSVPSVKPWGDYFSHQYHVYVPEH